MAIHGIVDIYSNDGETVIVTFSTQNNRVCTLNITDSGLSFKSLYNGVEDSTSKEWVYDGTKKFLGLSKTQGSNSVDNGYGIGNTISFDNMESVNFYIVEGEPVTPTLAYDLTKLNLSAGTYNISVVAKANGYQNSVASEAVEFTIAESQQQSVVGTWVLNDGWTAESEYGTFNVNGFVPKSWNPDSNYDFIQMFVGYSYDDHEIYATDCIAFTNGNEFDGNYYYNNETTTITITGGDDMYNESLYNWLKANATKQEASTPVIKTFVYAQTQAFYSEPVHRQFEVGMTWSEFINSDYNAEQGLRPNYTEHVGMFIINSDGSVGFKGRMSENTSYQTISVFNGYGTTKTKSTDVVSSDITYTSSDIAGGSGN